MDSFDVATLRDVTDDVGQLVTMVLSVARCFISRLAVVLDRHSDRDLHRLFIFALGMRTT